MESALSPVPRLLNTCRSSGTGQGLAVPRRSSLGRFLLISLAIHAAALGLGVVYYEGFRGPELTLAQGALSLEIMNEAPGQNGLAMLPGEGAALRKKMERTIAREREVTPVPQPQKIVEPTVAPEPLQPVASTQPVAEHKLEAVSNSDDVVPLAADRKIESESKPKAMASTAAATPAGAEQSDKGQGKKAAMSGSSAPSVFQPGSPGGVSAAALRNPTPPYPETARRSGIEGVVVLRLNIDTEGRVRQAVVLKSSGRGDFDHAAVDTTERRWRYRPATSWGRPVESVEVVRVCFVLGEA